MAAEPLTHISSGGGGGGFKSVGGGKSKRGGKSKGGKSSQDARTSLKSGKGRRKDDKRPATPTTPDEAKREEVTGGGGSAMGVLSPKDLEEEIQVRWETAVNSDDPEALVTHLKELVEAGNTTVSSVAAEVATMAHTTRNASDQWYTKSLPCIQACMKANLMVSADLLKVVLREVGKLEHSDLPKLPEWLALVSCACPSLDRHHDVTHHGPQVSVPLVESGVALNDFTKDISDAFLVASGKVRQPFPAPAPRPFLIPSICVWRFVFLPTSLPPSDWRIHVEFDCTCQGQWCGGARC